MPEYVSGLSDPGHTFSPCIHLPTAVSMSMQTEYKSDEEGKCPSKPGGKLRRCRREGQADSFNACWCSVVGRADVFRSWPQYILLTAQTSAGGQPGINYSEERNYYCSCTSAPRHTRLGRVRTRKSILHVSRLCLHSRSWAKCTQSNNPWHFHINSCWFCSSPSGI